MPKAMIVDDSRAIRMILGKMLGELGYEVAQASNGQEALSAVDALPETPAFMLIDWNMPEMNGLELVRAIRSDQRFKSVPLVMVTTETEMEQMVHALAAGANEYVMKPFTREVITEKLRLVGVI